MVVLLFFLSNNLFFFHLLGNFLYVICCILWETVADDVILDFLCAYLILNLTFLILNLTFCNLLFFSIISNAIISFLCTAFLGICLGTYFFYIVDIQNIITDFAHNIHKIITCKNNEYI